MNNTQFKRGDLVVFVAEHVSIFPAGRKPVTITNIYLCSDDNTVVLDFDEKDFPDGGNEAWEFSWFRLASEVPVEPPAAEQAEGEYRWVCDEYGDYGIEGPRGHVLTATGDNHGPHLDVDPEFRPIVIHALNCYRAAITALNQAQATINAINAGHLLDADQYASVDISLKYIDQALAQARGDA